MTEGREKRLTPRPNQAALALALGYAVVAGLYIVFSSEIAARLSASVSDLARIELLKGVGFVVVTSGALFLLARGILGEVARRGLELAERNVALQRSERVATAGLLAASLAHDINNVLTSVRMSLGLLEEAEGDAATRREMEDSLARVSALSRRLLSVAGAEREDSRDYELTDAVDEGLALAAIHVDVRRCTVERAYPGHAIRLRGPARLLSRAVLNLVVNAAEATGPGGRIRVVARARDAGGVVEVHDDGPGLGGEGEAAIFQPFYTTKKTGTGLGLLSVRACAEEHGGSVEVIESALGGAAFRMNLPGVDERTGDQSSSQA